MTQNRKGNMPKGKSGGAFASRIVGEGEEAPGALLANPQNWRRHPKEQRDALRAMLRGVGWVQRVIVNRTTGHLVDGHLRVEVAAEDKEQSVPVIYVELTETEERAVLAAIDPIGGMADTDQAQLDELLAGGSKMRYMLPLIAAMPAQVIVYASPAVGYAQIALAHVCAILRKKAVIFVAKRKTPHHRTIAAKAAGADVYQVPHGYLSHVQAKARRFADDTGAQVVPWGVDTPAALEHFAAAARGIEAPAEVWACAGSGALIRGLQLAWPGAAFNAVQVGATPNVGRARLYRAPEKYEAPARIPPPWPSCDNYDAKVWRFAREHAADGALIWNVGA